MDRRRELDVLFRAGLAGDQRSYRAFLTATADFVRIVTVRALRPGSGVDVEDVVQETLLAVHLKRHTFRGDGQVAPWLAAIARYKVVDALRRRGVVVHVAIEDVEDRLAAEEAEPCRSRDIDRALAALSPAQRRVGFVERQVEVDDAALPNQPRRRDDFLGVDLVECPDLVALAVA